MKTFAKNALLRSGLLRLAARLRANSAAILMYHSVLEDPQKEDDSLGGIIHSRDAFQGQMELLAREFHPLSLEELGAGLAGKADLPERSVIVTFDDGYTDNYQTAMPILDRVGVPATFYVTVDCLEHRQLPWPSRLRFSFRSTRKTSWADNNGEVWNLTTAQGREYAYLKVCDQVCQLAGEHLTERVRQIEDELDAKLPEAAGQLMMTWEQVAALAKSGHIVGSHTMTHPNMAFLGIEDARNEFLQSKQKMEERLGVKVQHFSYPCPALSPNWNAQTLEESRKAGYQTAVTTTDGLTRRDDNPLCLKRLRPSKTVQGLRWNLETAFAGRTS